VVIIAFVFFKAALLKQRCRGGFLAVSFEFVLQKELMVFSLSCLVILDYVEVAES